jgi:hypothetical protein
MSPTAVPSGKLGFSNSICSVNGVPDGNPSLEGETQLEKAMDRPPIRAITRERFNDSLTVETRTDGPA